MKTRPRLMIRSVLILIPAIWLALHALRGVLPGAAIGGTKADTSSTGLGFAALQKLVDLAYLTPIEFHGKVVDQHGDPVPAADVVFDVNDNATSVTPSIHGVSDANGMFSITGVHGITLSVGVRKKGYRGIPPVDGKVTSSGFFEYYVASGPPAASHRETPAVFTLHKVGRLEPLTRINETYDFRGNGIPFVLPLDRGCGHAIHIKCICQRGETTESQDGRYDWYYEIAVPDGDLADRKDPFVFEAPADGYRKSDRVEYFASMPRGYGGWTNKAERSYFIRFQDHTFARVTMRLSSGVVIDSQDNMTLLYWKSFYNPMVDSRNLESEADDP